VKKQNSMFNTIVKATAHTVTEVSKIYHSEWKNDSQETEENSEETDSIKATAFPFGTPFSNITKFTKGVEVFTKHIDTLTRERFSTSTKGDK